MRKGSGLGGADSASYVCKVKINLTIVVYIMLIARTQSAQRDRQPATQRDKRPAAQRAQATGSLARQGTGSTAGQPPQREAEAEAATGGTAGQVQERARSKSRSNAPPSKGSGHLLAAGFEKVSR